MSMFAIGLIQAATWIMLSKLVYSLNLFLAWDLNERQVWLVGFILTTIESWAIHFAYNRRR